jgi:hypothetical protein
MSTSPEENARTTKLDDMIQRDVLELAIDDYTALSEVLALLRTSYKRLRSGSLLPAAQRAMCKLVEDSLLEVVRYRNFGSDEIVPMGREEAQSALREKRNWGRQSVDSWHVRFTISDRGVRVWNGEESR